MLGCEQAKRATRCCSSFFLPWRVAPETVRGRAGWVRGVRGMDAAAKPPGTDSRRPRESNPPGQSGTSRLTVDSTEPSPRHEGLSRWPESSQCRADPLAQCFQILANASMPVASFSVAIGSAARSAANFAASIGVTEAPSAAPATSLRGSSPWSASSFSSRSGEMVRRSQPASASICAVERNEAPITTVGEPRRLNSAYTPRTNFTPGSSSMVAGVWPLATYQSRIRPTNGEIRNAPASLQASAWVGLKIRVRLQSMPSACRMRAASTPSQVAAILIRIFRAARRHRRTSG